MNDIRDFSRRNLRLPRQFHVQHLVSPSAERLAADKKKNYFAAAIRNLTFRVYQWHVTRVTQLTSTDACRVIRHDSELRQSRDRFCGR